MATTSPTAYAALSIPETSLDEEGERQHIRLRRDLDVGAFGISAVRTPQAQAAIVPEHDETGPGADRHEEVYVVLNGHAVFTVEGEEIDAPQGTAVFVRDPEAKRSAVSKEAGTTVLAVAGRRGEAWRPTPGELMQPFFGPYEEKDYEGALAVAESVLEAYPGNGLALFNVACMESLLGRRDEAVAHLGEALEAAPRLLEQARTDEDFEPIRDDPRYQELVA
jgi:quercetin dioxygenase-like cupin family protein